MFRLLRGGGMAITAILLAGTAVVAQTPPIPEPVRVTGRTAAADALIAEGRRLHAAFDAAAALERFRSAVRTDSLHYEALWLAAAESVAVGILEDDIEASNRLFAAGVGYARRSLKVRPDGVEGHEWLAVALGRHALSVGVRERVRFAEEILAIASRAIELDSNSAVGNHVVGQWHSEVRRLSGFERFFVRRFLGGKTFGSASLDTALYHVERAVELNPTELVHRFELARIYLDLERVAEARAEFQAMIDQPLVAPTDPVYKERARTQLARLDPSRDK